MNATTEIVSIHKKATVSRDPKDKYLLDLSLHVEADYLVTGDKDLLVLKEYSQTKIISFSELIVKLRERKN